MHEQASASPTRSLGRLPLVLVAEEDEALREELSTMLRNDGYQVVDVEDGFELKDYLDAAILTGEFRLPDIIVCESAMEGVNGLLLLQDLRNLGVEIPFILLDSGEDSDLQSRADDLGVDVILELPLDAALLRQAVHLLE